MTPQLMNKFWMECRIWNSSASVLSEWRRFGRQPIMFTELLNVLRWNFGSKTCYYEMSISRRKENGVANDSYFGIIDFSTRQIVFEMWTYRQCLNSGSFFIIAIYLLQTNYQLQRIFSFFFFICLMAKVCEVKWIS